MTGFARPALSSIVLLVLAASLYAVSSAFAQSVDSVSVTAERACAGRNNPQGLQCAQYTRGRAHGRFSTLQFEGGHVTGGMRESIAFSQTWSTALPRDASNVPRRLLSLFVHNDTATLPSRIRPADSATYEPVTVELRLNAPVLAKRLEKRGVIPFAQYFDTHVRADEFAGDIDPSEVFQNPAQLSIFVNGTNATCGGEPVRITDIFGTACSQLLGAGGIGELEAAGNANANDPRIRGDNPSALWEDAMWYDVATVARDRECTAALCYPCPGAGVDEVTLVRSIPIAPECAVWHTVDSPRLALSGTLTLRFNVTNTAGVREERVHEVELNSLRHGALVDDTLRISAVLEAVLPDTLRERVFDQRHEGVYVLCEATESVDKIDMGATNPYTVTAQGSVTAAPESIQFETDATYDVPFYYMSTGRALEYYGADGACQHTRRNAPSRALYSAEERVTTLCASIGADNLVRGGGVPGFEQCAAAGYDAVTPAQILSELNQWQFDYHQLDKDAQRLFARNNLSEHFSPLWDPDSPNLWLHTPSSTTFGRVAATPQDMWIMYEPPRNTRIPLRWKADVSIHEALIEVLDPNEDDTIPDVADLANMQAAETTAAPVVLQYGSGCRYGGLLLHEYGATGLSKDGTRPDRWPDQSEFGFALVARVCTLRGNAANYTIESNCTSFVDAALGSERSYVHSERVQIRRDNDAPVNSATSCYTFTTPYYSANRSRLHNYTQNNPDVLKQDHLRVGYCQLRAYDPDSGVEYQTTLKNATGAVEQFLAGINHTFNAAAAVPGHPDLIGFNCLLDTRAALLAPNDDVDEENEDKDTLRYQTLFYITIGVGVPIVLILSIIICACYCSRQNVTGAGSTSTKVKMQ